MRWLALLALLSGASEAQDTTHARLDEPTGRHDHVVLGDAIEWAAREMRLCNGRLIFASGVATRIIEVTLDPVGQVLTRDPGPLASLTALAPPFRRN